MGIRTQLQGIENLLFKVEDFGVSWFVDGTNGSDTYSGLDWDHAKATIQAAVTAASAGDKIFIAPKLMAAGATDPNSYAETIIIPATHSNLALIGVSRGRTQAGLPQIKKGSGSTAQITIRACGCLIANLGINGAGATGGGILLDDDGTTKTALGTTIIGCHFKNCKVSTTDGRTGGAIMWSANGGAWQVLIKGNRFYNNVADVVLIGTAQTVPQDVVIEDNEFSGTAASVDVNLYLAGGSGMNGVVIRNNVFGQLPAVGSGSVVRYVDMTGCINGMFVDNVFGCQTNTTGGTKLTFKASGTAAKIPVTVHVARCYGQSITTSESGEITIA